MGARLNLGTLTVDYKAEAGAFFATSRKVDDNLKTTDRAAKETARSVEGVGFASANAGRGMAQMAAAAQMAARSFTPAMRAIEGVTVATERLLSAAQRVSSVRMLGSGQTQALAAIERQANATSTALARMHQTQTRALLPGRGDVIDAEFTEVGKGSIWTKNLQMPKGLNENISKTAGAIGLLSMAMGTNGGAAQKWVGALGGVATAFAVGGPILAGLAAGVAAFNALSEAMTDAAENGKLADKGYRDALAGFGRGAEARAKEAQDALTQAQRDAQSMSATPWGRKEKETTRTVSEEGKRYVANARRMAEIDAQLASMKSGNVDYEQMNMLEETRKALAEKQKAQEKILPAVAAEGALVAENLKNQDAISREYAKQLAFLEKIKRLEEGEQTEFEAMIKASAKMYEALGAARFNGGMPIDPHPTRGVEAAMPGRPVASADGVSLSLGKLSRATIGAASSLDEIERANLRMYAATEKARESIERMGVTAGPAAVSLVRDIGMMFKNNGSAIASSLVGALVGSSGGATFAGALGSTASIAGAALGGPGGAMVGQIAGAGLEKVGDSIDRLSALIGRLAPNIPLGAVGQIGGGIFGIGAGTAAKALGNPSDPVSVMNTFTDSASGLVDVFQSLTAQTKSYGEFQRIINKANMRLVGALEPVFEELKPLAVIAFDVAKGMYPLIRAVAELTGGIGLLYEGIRFAVNGVDAVMGVHYEAARAVVEGFRSLYSQIRFGVNAAGGNLKEWGGPHMKAWEFGKANESWNDLQKREEKMLMAAGTDRTHGEVNKALEAQRIAQEAAAKAAARAAGSLDDLSRAAQTAALNMPSGYRYEGALYNSESPQWNGAPQIIVQGDLVIEGTDDPDELAHRIFAREVRNNRLPSSFPSDLRQF